MSNENRSHKQQHCLRGKGAGHNIMARIVANYYSKKKQTEEPSQIYIVKANSVLTLF